MIGRRFLFPFFISLSVLFASFGLHSRAKVDQALASKLEENSSDVLTVIVTLKGKSVDPSLSNLPNSFEYRPYKMSLLMKNASGNHAEIVNFINKSKGDEIVSEISSLWLANAIVVKASRVVIQKLSQNAVVDSMHLSRVFHISDFIRDEYTYDPDDKPMGKFTYGLEKMNIPKLMELAPHLTGKHIRVGQLDTGVNPNHPDLLGKVIAFKDFVGSQDSAYDDNDHGTHTAGTIAGGATSGTRIGVAPEADLIVGKVFDKDGGGQEDVILKAMEWIVDPDGNPNTNDGPLVVSNSWGGPQGTEEAEKPFSDAVRNWVSLGIFPCFAAGNEGPDPSTVGTPGGFPHSFAVGATDENDMVTEFSSRGPFLMNGKTYKKPDVSAPGNKIYSSLSNGGWAKFSGTSMATPHVAGLIALLYQANPKMTVDKTKRYIINSSKDVDQEGYDFNTGWGRVDALKALSDWINTQIEIPFGYNYINNQ